MNMIFNDNIIKNFYEKLFKLVLKVNTAFSSVTRLCHKGTQDGVVENLRNENSIHNMPFSFRFTAYQNIHAKGTKNAYVQVLGSAATF